MVHDLKTMKGKLRSSRGHLFLHLPGAREGFRQFAHCPGRLASISCNREYRGRGSYCKEGGAPLREGVRHLGPVCFVCFSGV